ncbi:MAG TPA: PIN domain nuclease [Gammaproteobacteria bacterium]|nr:PIN domain nuclease [Gammaproteobacteria bacterium]
MSRILLDTNIVLRLIDRNDKAHSLCLHTVEALFLKNKQICLVPQVLIELWVVATRPVAQNGLGWSPKQTRIEIDHLLHLFELLPDTEQVFQEWLNLVSQGVSGKRGHDARLAACVITHEVEAIVTLNPSDFNGFGISVIKP